MVGNSRSVAAAGSQHHTALESRRQQARLAPSRRKWTRASFDARNEDLRGGCEHVAGNGAGAGGENSQPHQNTSALLAQTLDGKLAVFRRSPICIFPG